MKTKLLLLALGLTGIAHATSFDFSYAFGDGSNTLITGTLDGTQDGNFVDNVSNVTLSFNGIQIAGPLFTASFDDTLGYVPGAIVSFDLNLNNFVFADGDVGNGGGYSELFTILTGSQVASDYATFYSSSQNLFPLDSPPNASWSLTPQTQSSVPDSGSTAALLGVAGLGLAWARRRF
jgi:hypothetical protein